MTIDVQLYTGGTANASDLAIDVLELTRLRRLTPLRLLACVVFEWFLIVGSATVATLTHNGWLIALAGCFIGTRQHALLVLMHEFSHRQLSRTRAGLNDAVGDFLTALPFFITIHGFRRDHAAHHAHTSTLKDPNWASAIRKPQFSFPKSRADFLVELLKHALGVHTAREIKGYLFDAGMSVNCPATTRVRQLVFALVVVGTVLYFDGWTAVAVFWFLPMFTVLMALLYLRDVGEHFALPQSGVEASRTVIVGPLERWLIAPYAVGFHTEHHLHPAVPFCHLSALHSVLMRQPGYAQRAVITRGYFLGLMREVQLARGASKLAPLVRFLTLHDIPVLLELEKEKWDDEQAASGESMAQRIALYPRLSVGAFCPLTGRALASLFLKPAAGNFWQRAQTWQQCVDLPSPQRSQSLFGISLSSREPRGVDALLEFFWPHALAGGWRHIYLGSPVPGFAAWRRKHSGRSAQEYVDQKRAGVPCDSQLRYYFGRGFKDIISVKHDYFPHQASLDYGVILRGTVPLSVLGPVWRTLPLKSTQRVTRQLSALL